MEIVSFKTRVHPISMKLDIDQFRMEPRYLTPAVSLVIIPHVGEAFQKKCTSLHVPAVISAGSNSGERSSDLQCRKTIHGPPFIMFQFLKA